MTEKELIKKLNNLHHIQPDAAWKKRSREILLSQISNTSVAYEPSRWQQLWTMSKNFTLSLPRPAMAFSGLIVVLITGMAISNNTFVNPSDALNIARVISEKAKLSFTFDETEKNKMRLQFASSHAREIVGTLSQPDSQASTEAADRLRDSFKEEISRMRLAVGQPSKAVDQPEPVSASSTDADIKVSVADSGRADQGLQVSTPSSTAAAIVAASATSTLSVPKTVDQILEDAEKLFNDKNYKEAAEKLNQVDSLIK